MTEDWNEKPPNAAELRTARRLQNFGESNEPADWPRSARLFTAEQEDHIREMIEKAVDAAVEELRDRIESALGMRP
jgi:hypothetical protein